MSAKAGPGDLPGTRRLASPAASGPAGSHFEAQVAASYMLAMLASAPARGLPDARVERVRDAYLAEFVGLASRAELVRSAELACQVAKVARVLSWTRALAALGADEDAELARAPLHWFGMLLDPSPVGVGG